MSLQEGAWGLPPVLQGLEREVLNALMQDESKILSILNDDGTINEWKLDQLRRDLHLPPRGFRPSGDEFRGGFLPNPGMYNDNHYGYGDEDRYSGQFSPDIEPPSFGHNMQRNESFPRARVSRWSAPASETSHDLLASSNDIYGLWENEGVIPWQREGRGAQFREASVPTIDKYGPGGGGSGGSGFLREDRNRFSADDDAGRKRVRPQKTNTPCKFFNTPKGCQFGSKCAFGHYAESSAPERAPVQGSLGGVPKRSRFSPPATMTDSFAL